MSSTLEVVIKDEFQGNRLNGAIDPTLWTAWGVVKEEAGKLRLQGTGSHPYIQTAKELMSPTAAAPIELKMSFVASNHFTVFTQASVGSINGEVQNGMSFFYPPGGSWQIIRTQGGKPTGLTGAHWMKTIPATATIHLTIKDDGSTFSVYFQGVDSAGTVLGTEQDKVTYTPFTPSSPTPFVGMRGRNGGWVMVERVAINQTISIEGLVAHWKFAEGANERLGSFGATQLQGTSVSGGKLVTGAGKYAYAQGYTGAVVKNKTLVSILTLNNLAVTAGSAMTIDAIKTDQFDGIVYSEREAHKWMPGSSNFSRTQVPLSPGYEETAAGQRLVMAITYEDMGNNTFRITTYRNGVQIGQYTKGPVVQYSAGDTEIIFGARHIMPNRSDVRGAIDASIEETMLFSRALTADEIKLIR